MSKLVQQVLGQISADDRAALYNELHRMQGGGEAVVVPGRNAGTVTSGARKAVGADAITPGQGNMQDNHSYFEAWNDPSRRMNPNTRKAMLQMDLNEAGYKDARAFKGLGDFIRSGMRTHRSAEFISKVDSYYKDMNPNFLKARGVSSTSGESGGFLLMPEFAPNVDQIVFETSLVARINKLTIGGAHLSWPRAKDTSRVDGSRHSGATGHWIDEGNPIPESNFHFALTKLAMKKLVVVVFFPPELLSDTDYAIETYLRESLRTEINWQIDRTIMWGTGGAEPTGFMNGGSLITVAKETGQAADTVVTENVVKMQARCHGNAGKSPVWIASKSVGPQVATFDVGNFPVSININNGGIAQAPSRQLRGLEVVESEFCAQVGSLGDIILTELSGYIGIMRSLIREDVSMHYEFLSDLNALRVIVGFDGKPLYPTAITPFTAPGSDAVDTLSPFVALAERA